MEVVTSTTVIPLCHCVIEQETDTHLGVNVLTAVISFFFFYLHNCTESVNKQFNSNVIVGIL